TGTPHRTTASPQRSLVTAMAEELPDDTSTRPCSHGKIRPPALPTVTIRAGALARARSDAAAMADGQIGPKKKPVASAAVIPAAAFPPAATSSVLVISAPTIAPVNTVDERWPCSNSEVLTRRPTASAPQ